MIDFALSDAQVELRVAARRVAEELYADRALEWDQQHTALPDPERKRLGELGFLGLALPERYSGGGGTLLDALLVIEELAKSNLPAAFQVFESNTGPARVIELFGTEEQKQRLLPSIARGESTLALSISEPEAGSAATDIAARARLEGSQYVVEGSKRWCSGGGHAEQYLMYVRLTDSPGAKAVGALVVDGNAKGLTFGRPERLMGFHGIPSADIHLDGVRVPADNLVVPAGGFQRLFSAFSIERLGNATMSLALGQASLDRTVRYVQERQQFGKPIIEHQAVQMSLAEMIVQVDAARLLVWRAAVGAGTGTPHPLEASVAKCFANEMAKKVSDLGIQLHGGYGYHPDYHVERYHRDAHGWALAGGTPNMQRIRIVSEFLNRRFDQRK